MSVSVAAAVLLRKDLVQVSDLDPEQLVVMQNTLPGDAGGNSSTITATVPTGFAAMLIRASTNVNGNATATNVVTRVRIDGDTIDEFASGPFNIDAFQRFQNVIPAPVLWINDLIQVDSQIDNVLAQTHGFELIMYLWDLQTARNLPQKFFWPGTLS